LEGARPLGPVSLMERYPVAPKKRKRIEMSIRLIDLIIYAAVFASGIYAAVFTPVTVARELKGWEWLVFVWAGFLLIGGLVGFVGRASTIWLLEPAACFASATGMIIYAVVLGRTAFDTLTTTVAMLLVIVALLGVVRRYAELQLFGSNPDHRDPKSRFKDAWERRIPNVPSRG
jgi:hypothetical protein